MLFCRLLVWFSTSVGAVRFPARFPLPSGGCASGLRCLRRQFTASLQSRLPFLLVLLFMSLLSFTCSCGRMVWSQVCGPSCCSCVLGSCGVSVAPFCRLGLWSHPLLFLFLAGFLPLEFVRTWVGRLRSCLGSCLLLVGNSPSLVLVVFAWRFLLCGCPGSLSFS